VCSGAILGSGIGRRLAEVRWTVAGRMAVAWLLTLPAAAAVGALAASVATHGDAGVLVAAIVALAFAASVYIASRRDPVHSANVNQTPDRSSERLPVAACAAIVLYEIYLIVPQFH
jgi:inorganic phosphate transporter, PiT family